MQSLTGTSLLASYHANRGGCYKVEVAWDGTNYIDESANLITMDVSREATARTAGIAVAGKSGNDSANVTLRNVADRYTPWGSGALASYINAGAWMGLKVKLSQGFYTQAGVAEYVQVFAGRISDITQQTRNQSVTLRLRDNSFPMQRAKVSSPLYTNKRADQIIALLVALLPAAQQPTISADYGIYTIPFAWVHTENLWNELSLLAEAEGGRLYFSPTGVLVFENAGHLVTGAHATSVATFTVSQYADMVSALQAPDYWNKAIVRYAPYVLENYQPVWECDDPDQLHVRPGDTHTITADFDAPVLALRTLRAGIDYVAVTAGGLDANSDLTITVTGKAQEASIAIANGGSRDVYLTHLRLIGRRIGRGQQQRVEVSDTSDLATQAGQAETTIELNSYIQSWAQADSLAHFLVDRGKYPRQTWTLTNLRALPWLEIGDRVTVKVKGGTSAGDAFIQRIRFVQPAQGGPRMDLALLPVANLFASDSYFELGTDTSGVYWY